MYRLALDAAPGVKSDISSSNSLAVTEALFLPRRIASLIAFTFATIAFPPPLG